MSLIYRGTSSDDVHFNVTERRVYNAPAFDVSGIEVPGRSGDILNSQERFKNKSIVYTGFIRSSDFPGDTTWERLSRGLRTIKAWVCGDAGKYHDLTDDYDPGFVRRAFVSGETAISEVLDRPDGATITITFMAEPFMYEESDPIEVPETGTASGAIASFEGVAAPLQSLKFSIEPSQDLHGYSYPWPAGGGVNKYPIAIGEDVWVNNANATHSNNDGELLIVCAAQSNSGVYGNGQQRALLNQQSVAKTVSMDIKASVAMSVAVQGNIKDVTTSYQRISVTIAANTSAFLSIYGRGTAGTIYVKNVAITEDGSAAYAPYSNICPISGWAAVVGQQRGVNLLGSDALEPGYFGGTGADVDQSASKEYRTPNYIPVTGGSTLCVGYGNYASGESVWCAVCWYTANKVMIGNRVHNSLSPIASFVAPLTAAYARVTMRTYDHGTQYCFASYGQTTFVEQKGQAITFTLGQTVYGGTVDALRGKMAITHGYTELSSLSWTRITNGTVYIFDTTVADFTPTATSSDAFLSTYYTPMPNTAGYGLQNGQCVRGTGGRHLYVRDDTYTTAADFKTAAAGKYICYPLATPIEVDLTPVSVSSLLGQNNVWANTGNTEVVYVEPTENPTEWPSKPRLEITMAGAGTLTVNGKTWSIGAYTGTLICDSEIMDWYDASNLKNSLVSGDGFPELQPGENVITYTGGITKVVAKPRWRTL